MPPPSENLELLEALAEPPAKPPARIIEDPGRRIHFLVAISVVALGCIALIVLAVVDASSPPTPRVISLATSSPSTALSTVDPAHAPTPAPPSESPGEQESPVASDSSSPLAPIQATGSTDATGTSQATGPSPAVAATPRRGTAPRDTERVAPRGRVQAHEGLVRDPGF
jgi:hypothetical protein